MTAATTAPAAPGRLRPAISRPGAGALRLLRLELRHNAMAWLVPVAIGLFWLTAYRKVVAMPPLWNVRAAGLQLGVVLSFVVPVTGAAAWTGSREARRRVIDQVTITARSRWARLLVSWAATTIWALVAYVVCVAALYGETARQASGGGPLWWPAAVAAASLPAFSALGFVIGTFLPSRFTAPLAAIAGFFILALSTQPIHGSQSYWQVTPIVNGAWDLGTQAGIATFYPFLPDLSIAQVMFLAGFTIALLGLLALPTGPGGWRVRATAAGLTGAGLLAAGTAVGLAGTGTLDAHGMISIPALHDAASDRPIPYTPVCSQTAIPVCVNPAYASYLPVTANALSPLLSQLAGLPGAPLRIEQEGVTYQVDKNHNIEVSGDGPRASGTQPVFHFTLPDQLPEPTMTPQQMASQVDDTYGSLIVARVVGYGPGVSPAQNAAAIGIMLAAGQSGLDAYHSSLGQSPSAPGGPAGQGGPGAGQSPEVAPGTPAYAAAERFASLPASARHAWLAGHLTALRAGLITLAQLP